MIINKDFNCLENKLIACTKIDDTKLMIQTFLEFIGVNRLLVESPAIHRNLTEISLPIISLMKDIIKNREPNIKVRTDGFYNSVIINHIKKDVYNNQKINKTILIEVINGNILIKEFVDGSISKNIKQLSIYEFKTIINNHEELSILYSHHNISFSSEEFWGFINKPNKSHYNASFYIEEYDEDGIVMGERSIVTKTIPIAIGYGKINFRIADMIYNISIDDMNLDNQIFPINKLVNEENNHSKYLEEEKVLYRSMSEFDKLINISLKPDDGIKIKYANILDSNSLYPWDVWLLQHNDTIFSLTEEEFYKNRAIIYSYNKQDKILKQIEENMRRSRNSDIHRFNVHISSKGKEKIKLLMQQTFSQVNATKKF